MHRASTKIDGTAQDKDAILRFTGENNGWWDEEENE